MKLRGLSNIAILTEFQKLFFKLTGFYLTFIDTNGEFVTEDRGREKFCLAIASMGMSKECDKSNHEACKKIIKEKKPYVYTCFAGLTEIISPIMIEKDVVGAALAGQVRSPKNRLLLKKKNVGEKKYRLLKRLFDKVPVLSEEKIMAAKDFLFIFINYILKIEAEILHLSEEEVLEPKDKIIQKAMDYLEKNYEKKIVLRDISSYLNISPYYFSHIFKKKTGVSFHKYAVELKLRYALQMLKNPDIPIKEIAYRLGFSDEFHFCKVFKKKYKFTPGYFRKNYFK